WGRVKFVHTSPTRSASGLEVLYLMAYDYVRPPGERPPAVREELMAARSQDKKEGVIVRSARDAADFARVFSERRADLRRWLERCEAGLGPEPRSSKLLTDDMFHVGSRRYDAILTYEHLVFSVFDRIDNNADSLAEIRVVYAQPTLMNEHPVVLI